MFSECLVYANRKHKSTTFWALLLEPIYSRLETGLVGGASIKRKIIIPLQVAVTMLLKLAVTVRLVPLKMVVTVLLKLPIPVISLTDRKLVKNIAL